METKVLFKDLPNLGYIKDVDMSKRYVTGYLSTWGELANGVIEVDSDGDVMQKGAFAKTIAMNGPNAANRIWHLFNHSHAHPINKFSQLFEDEIGLGYGTKFPDTKWATDILVLHQEKAITEHSIGFNIIQSRQERTQDNRSYQVIQEVRLWEGSSVLWGANQFTPTTGIKTEEMEIKTKVLDSLLHNGNLSDEMFMQIEQLLKDIKEMFRPATPPEPKEEEADILHSYFTELNKRLTTKLN